MTGWMGDGGADRHFESIRMLPAAMRIAPITTGRPTLSWRKRKAKMMVKTTLNLSMGPLWRHLLSEWP